MDKKTYTFLKMIYNGPHHTLRMDDTKHFPFYHGYSLNDSNRIMRFLRKYKYIEQHGLTVCTTIAGNVAIERYKHATWAFRLSIIATVLSILSLLKPSSFDLIAAIISALR
ncbi:MAG: hypothetical protein PUB57_09445 [Selenomonadaceae bacterium]|nr:hypothetical protein [Selenomonadaceae bacterium]